MRAWLIAGLSIALSATAHAQPRDALTLEPGSRLGAVRIGMSVAELAELGLAHRAPGPGRPARYGPYQVLFEAGVVQSAGVSLREIGGVRTGGRVLRAATPLGELMAALPHCVYRAQGGAECAGNGVRVAPSAEGVEIWVQARPEPLLVVPGVQLGAVRIGMSEEELRATGRPVRDMIPGQLWVDGVTAVFEEGRIVRARSTLAYFGRLRIGTTVVDEGAPERERAFGTCAERSDEGMESHVRACARGGVRFSRGMGTDEEIEVRAASATPGARP